MVRLNVWGNSGAGCSFLKSVAGLFFPFQGWLAEEARASLLFNCLWNRERSLRSVSLLVRQRRWLRTIAPAGLPHSGRHSKPAEPSRTWTWTPDRFPNLNVKQLPGMVWFLNSKQHFLLVPSNHKTSIFFPPAFVQQKYDLLTMIPGCMSGERWCEHIHTSCRYPWIKSRSRL